MDLSKTIVFKITDKSTQEPLYVSSTRQSLSQRKSSFKVIAARNPDKPLFTAMSKIGWNNVDFVLLEHLPNVKDRHEVAAAVTEWIGVVKPTYTNADSRMSDVSKPKVIERVVCGCGSKMLPTSVGKHQKSKKHLKWLESSHVSV